MVGFKTRARNLNLRVTGIKAGGNCHEYFEQIRKILVKSATVLDFHIVMRIIDVN